MVAKAKTIWYCAECGHKQMKWAGQCTQCQKWNTLHEEVELPEVTRYATVQQIQSKPYRLRKLPTKKLRAL